jgi:hypothetical protein
VACSQRASQGQERNRKQTPTLSDLGITKDQSSRWQKLAAVPVEELALLALQGFNLRVSGEDWEGDSTSVA